MTWQPKNKVVVPIDFSNEADHALTTALELASDPSAVHLVHVLFPLDAVSPGVVLGDVSDEKREQAVRKRIDELLKQKNVAGAHVEVRFGNPGLEITDYADEIGADLIVISSHGYHGVKRLFLGSVAERVIRHAHCSVLVLRRSDAD